MDEKIPPYTIPQDVLLRYGGISNTQKEFLYAELQSLNFVYIPNFLKPQISGVHSLYRYGVCKSLRVINGESYGYFVCPLSLNPESHSFDAELKFCCGTPPQQYCCSSSQFSSGIHIVRSDLLISPSIVIGVSIGFLLLAIFFMIYAYSRLAHGLREKSTKLFYETSCVKCSNGSHISPQPLQSLELPLLSDMQPNEPPKKILLSSSRLAKISPERAINDDLSGNKNSLLLPSYGNKNNISGNGQKPVSSQKLNNSCKVNISYMPIKARPIRTIKK